MGSLKPVEYKRDFYIYFWLLPIYHTDYRPRHDNSSHPQCTLQVTTMPIGALYSCSGPTAPTLLFLSSVKASARLQGLRMGAPGESLQILDHAGWSALELPSWQDLS
jgi:hypothetical protein